MLKVETNEQYHSSEGISKSGLWEIYTKSPFHYAHTKKQSSPTFDYGTAVHTAILEPDKFDESIIRGPEDRRGSKWRDAMDEAEHKKAILLTASDYDDVLSIREAADADKNITALLKGETIIERSAYHKDDEYGLTVKCRPDLYNKSLSIMADVKSTASAEPHHFIKSIVNFGYHVQEAMYTDVFTKASNLKVDAFVFIAIEKPSKGSPAIIQCYELDADAVKEGYLIYRKALDIYANCVNNKSWPAYGGGIKKLSIPKWAFKEEGKYE